MRIKLLIPLLAISLLFGCGSKDEIAVKKEKLETLKKEQDDLSFKIRELEKELKILDPTALDAKKSGRLVSTLTAQKKDFQKFIDIQGNAESEFNVTMSAEVGGEIISLPVKEGEKVQKGQLLAQLDDALIRKEIEDLKVTLELATTVFERQEKLWKQNIGSEIQFLEAKNKKENLQAKMNTLRTQSGKTRITAPVNGTVENIRIKIGEMATPGMTLFSVVNLDEIIIKADVPERYVGKVAAGDEVAIRFPAMDTERGATISSVGNIINPVNRTFRVEIKIPNKDHALKANLLAIVKINDYRNPNVVTIPTRLIQQSNGDRYVYLAVRNSDTPKAKKVLVEPGMTYASETEILSGINEGDVLIDEGAHDVSDGSILEIQSNISGN